MPRRHIHQQKKVCQGTLEKI